MIARSYSGLKGDTYSVGREIGRGGEGAVLEVRENTNSVVKVYTEALDKEKIGKLQSMVAMQDAELNKFAAWPLDLVNDGNQVSGFTMKKLEGFVPLHMLFSPMDRKRLFPDKGYNFLVHVARNVAMAFHKIHKAGIVIGDVNEGNILVSANGMVALIDCDSFQIKNGNNYYFCEVGIPRYTPPELLEKGTFTNVVRTFNTDSFSLAILLFQLLFMGRHPFTGRNLTNEEIDEEKAIRTREFAYSLTRRNKKLSPAKNSFDLQNLTPGAVQLFHQAFEATENRPTPYQWVQELDALNKEMTTCRNSKIHSYPQKMLQCPWCKFNEESGIVYFLDDSYLKAIPELKNIESFINGFKLDKIEIRKVSEDYVINDLTAQPINKKFIELKKRNRIVVASILLITMVMSFLYPVAILAGIVTLIVFNLLFPSRKELREELLARRKRFETLKTNFKKAVAQHNNPANLNGYKAAAVKMTELIVSFRGLPNEFNDKKRIIEDKHYNLQYHHYLRRFEISKFPIPNFGPSKKELLNKNGVRDAADVSLLNNLNIKGIGPKNIQVLFTWQRQMGSAFMYTPDYDNINKDINLVANDISSKKKKLEADIKTEYLNLQYARTKIKEMVGAMERNYTLSATNLYQAELDLQEFKAFMKLF